VKLCILSGVVLCEVAIEFVTGLIAHNAAANTPYNVSYQVFCFGLRGVSGLGHLITMARCGKRAVAYVLGL
jgi:hypothetical protein